MPKPIAIARYERLYWASFVLDMIVTARTWDARAAIVQTYPVLAKAYWLLPTIQAIGVAVTILLWYFTARKPSGAARWTVVVLAAVTILGAVMALWSLATGASAFGAMSMVSLVADALYVAAAAQLFAPDARAWFAEPSAAAAIAPDIAAADVAADVAADPHADPYAEKDRIA